MDISKPVHLLAGGRSTLRRSPDPLVQAALVESGASSPAVAYVGTANDDDKSFFSRVAGMFREAGARRVDHALISPARADLNKAKTLLQNADIVFISGGDVELGMQVLEEKKMADFLARLYQQGKPFFGLSAGSIMLAHEWVRWQDPEDDASAELFPCLGFAPVICDTHGEGEGWEELQAAMMLKQAGTRGYGIVSGTAIKAFPDGRVEALGGAVHQYIRRGTGVVRGPDILPTL
jgi:peptidase E